MKKLAEFANRVQDHLKYCPLSEDDVMNMLFSEDFVYDLFNDFFLHDGNTNQDRDNMWLSMDLMLDYSKFNKLKKLTPSFWIMDDYDDGDDSVIVTNSGGYIEYIRIGYIKIHFKPIPLAEHQAEYDFISADYDLIRVASSSVFKNNELIRNFLMKCIDFEKTVSEIQNLDNMYDNDRYLNETSTSEYNESTFEEMLKVLNIYERYDKLTEILTD